MTNLKPRFKGVSGSLCFLLAIIAVILLADVATVASPLVEPPGEPEPYIVSESDDLDGDGENDTVTASPSGEGSNDVGKIEIESGGGGGGGGETVATIRGNEGGDRFGFSVTVACDLNGDSVKDLISGAPREFDGAGRAYIFFGPIVDEENLTADDADIILQSPDADTHHFGERVECIPDVNDDGLEDVIVDASHLVSGAEFVRSYIFAGIDGEHLDTLQGGLKDGGIAGTLPPCLGDLTGPGGQRDGRVNVDDLLGLINGWGACPPAPAACPADIAPAPPGALDGLVNVDDLLAVINAWGDCDFDNDGMPDWWEAANGLNPTIADASGDADGDGLTNLQEFQVGADPFEPDTDGDGTTDAGEVLGGSDPGDSSDGGIGPNSANVKYVMLRFGDQSCHNSETWAMRFNNVEYSFPDALAANCMQPQGTPHNCSGGWSCPLNAPREKGPIAIEAGESYEIQMIWKRTAFLDGVADYDWTCLIDACDSGGGSRQPLMEFHENGPGFGDDEWLPTAPVNGMFVHDPSHLLGEYWSGGSGSHTAAATLIATKIRLKSVKFGGQLHIITPDDGGQAYSGPHWLDADLDGNTNEPGDRRYPIALTRGTDLVVEEARFVVEPADLPVDGITVSGFNDVILFVDETPQIQGGELIASDMTYSPSGNTILYIEDFAVDWAVHQNDEELVDGQVSHNTVYVTLAIPTVNPLYHTVVHRACKHAAGQSTAQGAVDGIWGYFQGMVVRNHLEEPAIGFGYWRGPWASVPGAGAANTTQTLITLFNGRCGNWARFFRDVLKVHGLSAVITEVSPDAAAAGLLLGVSGLVAEGIGVKDYNVQTSPPTDLVGVPGQGGVADPASFFPSHAIVAWNNVLYDPSYGKGPFSGLFAWQMNSLDFISFLEQGTNLRWYIKNIPPTPFPLCAHFTYIEP